MAVRVPEVRRGRDRDRARTPRARPAGGVHRALRPSLDRRHPLLLDPGVPVQAGHVPRPRVVVPGGHRPATPASFPAGGICAEFCGLDHHKMRFDVRIVAPEEFQQWIVDTEGTSRDRPRPQRRRCSRPRPVRGRRLHRRRRWPRGAQGTAADGRRLADDDGPQGDRHRLRPDGPRLPRHRRCAGRGHAHGTGRARPAAGRRIDLQQPLHHPRQRDGVPVRRPVRLRPRQLPRAVADRCARPRLPPPQRPLLLAVPVRRGDHADRLPDRRWGRRVRLVRLPPAVGAARIARPRR